MNDQAIAMNAIPEIGPGTKTLTKTVVTNAN